MFIPLDRKPSWHNPPLLTLLLIALNVLVYYGFQFHDDNQERIAMDYYFSSSLPEMEINRYQQHLYGDSFSLSKPEKMDLFWKMQVDGEFLNLLKNDQIIKPGEEAYASWKQQRQQFDKLLNQVFSYRFSLKTSEPTATTIFSHMFLHADSAHLLGNMLFLFLFGFVLEIVLGRTLYVSTYLLAGVLSALFDIALNPGSAMWGLGASGAISGLAGMYTVIFGMRKIRFFYTLLFYFDYVKAPALIMLPAWLAYEFYQQYMYPDSGINNIAHIGGLLGGALIAFVLKRYTSLVNTDYLDEEERKAYFDEQLSIAMAKVGDLDFSAAKQILIELDENYPDNLEVQTLLFNIYKHNPDDEAFHHYSNKILSLNNISLLPVKQLYDTYHDYVTKSSQTRLKADQLLSLAIRFAKGAYMEEAENIMSYLTRRKPDYSKNAEGLMALLNQFKKSDQPDKFEHYFAILEKTYPGSKELQIAQQLANN